MFNRFQAALFTFIFVTPALFAEQAEEVPPRDSGIWQTVIMIAIALGFFYIILWRPEQKRRKALEELRGTLNKGDRVSAMGIIGTVNQVKQGTVILDMVDGSKIEVLKGAITEVIPKEEPQK